jgi:hypothetical protein
MLLDAGFLRHDGNVVTKAIFNKLLKLDAVYLIDFWRRGAVPGVECHNGSGCRRESVP